MKVSASQDSTFDYIVIGAGSSGCVIASRLTEDRNVSVLLLEAGPEDKSWTIHCPVGMESLMTSDRFNWQYFSEAETYLHGRKVEHPRGRVLGGSSSINGMVYTRGNALDYEEWMRDFGCEGWGYADVLPYFKRSETFYGESNEYRGQSGPLKVTRPDVDRDPLNRAFMEAGEQAGYPTTSDSNAFQQEGFHANECTIHGGQRCSTARAYLTPDVRNRPNLHIYTHTLVERILFQGKTATGVQIVRAGLQSAVKARREIVLSAGAFGSPQILQMSGVGPLDVLRKAKVEVVHALEGVGRNLQDHPDLIMQYKCITPAGLGHAVRFPNKILAGLQWFLNKSGIAASNHFETAAYIRTKAGIPFPNLKLEFLPIAFKPDSFEPYPGYSFQIHMTLLRAKSRGTVEIAAAKATDKPRIRFNYLAEEADREAFRSAVRLTREIAAQQSFSAYRGDELSPGRDVQSDDQLDRFVAERVATAFHPSGTCRMGRYDDDATVVGPDLRVRGLKNLRVADASIMPVGVSSNTNAPSIMIGEKAADIIRGKRLPSENKPYYVAPNWETAQR